MQNISIDNDVLVPRLADGWVISQTDTRVDLDNAAKKQRFEINAVTAEIIQLCDGSTSFAKIIADLCSKYPEAATEIQNDVETVIRELHEHGVIAFAPTNTNPKVYPIPARSPAHAKRKLCIGMATYDDYDGVYFSLQAIRLYHSEILDDVEFVVIDNHPSGPCADSLQKLGQWIKNYRYVPCDSIKGTAVRDLVFREANADYVLCMDSHVFLAPGSLQRLMDYFKANPSCKDLLQGPLLYDDLANISSHFKPEWSTGMYGTWAYDERAKNIDGDAFDIPMQGLGTFCCAKAVWPGFNSRFTGFGGEEGYIHEKFRQAGGRTLCLPFLRWMHRFNRPLGTRYVVSWEDRIRNYLIGCDELDLDISAVTNHFEQHLGFEQTARALANFVTERDNSFYEIDAIYCINLDSQPNKWDKVLEQAKVLKIDHRIRRFSAIETAENHHIGCALSHREIVQTAHDQGFKNVLVLEDDVIFSTDVLKTLERCLIEIKTIAWDLLFLGGHCWGVKYPLLANSTFTRVIPTTEPGPTCTHAVLYNQSSYHTILSEFPSEPEEMACHLKKEYLAIDQYFRLNNDMVSLLIEPIVATQPPLLKQERSSFTPLLSDSH